MDSLLVERDDHGVVTVTMNRPDKKNAISCQMWVDLRECFTEISENRDDRVVILTGAGGAFTSGADLTDPEMGDPRNVGRSTWLMRRVTGTVLSLHNLPQPTIAAVDGVAVGAGANLAFGCDLIVAAETARFSEIFLQRGLALDGGGSWLLPRLIGLHKAKEIAFLADLMSASEAAEVGLVNRVVPQADLMAQVTELARRIATRPPIQLALVKRQLNHSFSMSMAEALDWEGAAQAMSFATQDAREAMRAFVQKREPTFTGE